ncbi:hypothetical protein ACSBR1_031588 [Camellia fascicularis]
MKKMGDTHMVVATLIAAITFAAGFTMPGGYNNNEGSNQGMPLQLREAAFKVFVITNTIAVICSTSSVFLYVTASLYYVTDEDDTDKLRKRYLTALLLILIAVATMIVTFITDGSSNNHPQQISSGQKSTSDHPLTDTPFDMLDPTVPKQKSEDRNTKAKFQ